MVDDPQAVRLTLDAALGVGTILWLVGDDDELGEDVALGPTVEPDIGPGVLGVRGTF